MISRIHLAALFIYIVLVEAFNRRNEYACQRFGMTPYFEPKMVLGPQWRVYYTWNLKQKSNCLGMKFYEVNPGIVSRFYKEMGVYLERQPLWGAAVLYVTIGAAKHQMLLLADYGPPGRVHGVPNLTRDPTFMRFRKKKSVQLMAYQMKLLQGGEYLVLMDCLGGTVTLSARHAEDPPHISEIEAAAKKIDVGHGILSCKNIRNTSKSLVASPPDYDMK